MASIYDIKLYSIPEINITDAFKTGLDSTLIYEMHRNGLLLISNFSTKRIRRIVYNYALYFKREFGYDFIQYDEYEHSKVDECRAFLFRHDYDYAGGACCFRYRKYKDYHGWALQWIWIHPYLRNKGVFTEALHFFKKMFGDFFIEPPLSHAMKHLVNKMYGSYDIMLEKTKNINCD